MKTVAYYKDDKLLVTTFTDEQVELDFDHVVINSDILEPIESWYIEDGEIKIDQQKLIAYSRSQLIPISKRQFAFSLLSQPSDTHETLWHKVEEMINSNYIVKLEFELAKDISRDSPTVNTMIQQLGFTDEQVDQMWHEALQIK